MPDNQYQNFLLYCANHPDFAAKNGVDLRKEKALEIQPPTRIKKIKLPEPVVQKIKPHLLLAKIKKIVDNEKSMKQMPPRVTIAKRLRGPLWITLGRDGLSCAELEIANYEGVTL